MTIIEQIPIWVALASLIVAVLSLVRTRVTNAKMIDLNETVAELSRKQLEVIHRDESLRERPRILTSIARVKRHNQNLLIVNRGDGSAFNLNCVFLTHAELLFSDGLDAFPISEFRPSKNIKIPLARHLGSASSFKIRLSWEERDGITGGYDEELRF